MEMREYTSRFWDSDRNSTCWTSSWKQKHSEKKWPVEETERDLTKI